MKELKQGSKNVFDYYGEFADLIREYGEVLAKEMESSNPLYALSLDKINKLAAKAFEKGLTDDIRKSLIFQTTNSLKEVYELAKKFEEKEKCKCFNSMSDVWKEPFREKL